MNKSPTVSLRQRANNQAERLGFEPRERLPAHRISSADNTIRLSIYSNRYCKYIVKATFIVVFFDAGLSSS